MQHPSYILLYVTNPAESAKFYQDLLGCAPVENSPTFALFVLSTGLKLGLWIRDQIEPPAGSGSGMMDLSISLASADDVDATHAAWAARGVTVLQAPTDLDFGRSCVFADPDGHRLRVFAPST